MTSAFSWQNSISLCPASFCTQRPNLPVTPGISWLPTLHSSPWDSPGKNTGVSCHFLLQCMKVKSESEVAQSCLTPSNPMDCSQPGSSIHGIFQARVLEWGAIAFSLIMKRTSFFGISSRRSCRSSKNHSTSTSSALLVGT